MKLFYCFANWIRNTVNNLQQEKKCKTFINRQKSFTVRISQLCSLEKIGISSQIKFKASQSVWECMVPSHYFYLPNTCYNTEGNIYTEEAVCTCKVLYYSAYRTKPSPEQWMNATVYFIKDIFSSGFIHFLLAALMHCILLNTASGFLWCNK